MDPKHTGDMLRHLEKQDELLMDAFRSMSHELHKLQVEEEMLMRKFYHLMDGQGLTKKIKQKQDEMNVSEESKPSESKALVNVDGVENGERVRPKRYSGYSEGKWKKVESLWRGVLMHNCVSPLLAQGLHIYVLERAVPYFNRV